MIRVDNEDGIFGILFGLILLVLFAVTIGVLADKRLGFSSKKSEWEETISHDASHIVSLEQQLILLTEKDSAISKSLASHESDYRNLEMQTLEGQKSLIEKRQRISHLHADTAALQKSFAAYRKQQRESIQRSAIGETLAELITVEGKSYEQVVIKNVTDHGIEISHKHGLSRIEANSLPASWRARFQWNRE